MDDVTKALEAAGEAAREQLRASESCLSEACDIGPCDCASDAAAAAIAAFHRSMAEHWRGIAPDWFSRHTGFANAVEAAAKGDEG